MRTALVIIAAMAGTAHAAPLAEVVAARVAPALPQGLGIAHVYAPALEVDAKKVTVEVPGDLRLGRPSIKVIIDGATRYVPVQIGALVEVAVATHALAPGDALGDADYTIERRAADHAAPASTLGGATVQHAIAAGAAIDRTDVALAPPLPRGAEVALEIRRGRVRVRGTAILEANARPGGAAIARVGATKTLVHGTLVAPATLVVGDL